MTSSSFSLLTALLCVGSGCFVGGCLRYLTTLLFGAPQFQDFPWGTLAVNIVGCLLLGLFNGAMMQHHPSPALRLFLTVGLCGGFTTFSTFANDIFQLSHTSQWLTALIYMTASFMGGLICIAVGYILGGKL